MSIIICNHEQLEKMGISLRETIQELTTIDAENDLLEDGGEQAVRLENFYRATTPLWRVMLDDKQIIGYWSCAVLNSAYMCRVTSGQLRESDISAISLKSDLLSGRNALYFDCIALKKAYQGHHLSGLMLASIRDSIFEFSQTGVFLDSVWASIWSEQGVRLFCKLGFEHHITNRHRGEIYRATFTDFTKNLQRLCTLFEV